MRDSHSNPLLVVATIAATLGCGDASPEDETIQASAHGQLNWKRSATLERDLAAALELPVDELCTGPGSKPCIGELYLVPLGGNDPFAASFYRPVDSPLTTTTTAIDRVMLSACARRVTLDAGSSSPAVFEALEFGGKAPSADSEAISDTATALYRRFLARDPDPTEIELLGRLTETDEGERVEASEFAILACYAVGSTTEFLFF